MHVSARLASCVLMASAGLLLLGCGRDDWTPTPEPLEVSERGAPTDTGLAPTGASARPHERRVPTPARSGMSAAEVPAPSPSAPPLVLRGGEAPPLGPNERVEIVASGHRTRVRLALTPRAEAR